MARHTFFIQPEVHFFRQKEISELEIVMHEL